MVWDTARDSQLGSLHRYVQAALSGAGNIAEGRVIRHVETVEAV